MFGNTKEKTVWITTPDSIVIYIKMPREKALELLAKDLIGETITINEDMQYEIKTLSGVNPDWGVDPDDVYTEPRSPNAVQHRYCLRTADEMGVTTHPQLAILQSYPDAFDFEPTLAADCWLFKAAATRSARPKYVSMV